MHANVMVHCMTSKGLQPINIVQQLVFVLVEPHVAIPLAIHLAIPLAILFRVLVVNT